MFLPVFAWQMKARTIGQGYTDHTKELSVLDSFNTTHSLPGPKQTESLVLAEIFEHVVVVGKIKLLLLLSCYCGQAKLSIVCMHAVKNAPPPSPSSLHWKVKTHPLQT